MMMILMKSFVVSFVLFVASIQYSTSEELLGGWRQSTNETFIQECLRLALSEIHGVQVGEDMKSQIADVFCQTQIVNGLNIRLTFTLQNQKWRCTFYKSFIETLEMMLEACHEIHDDSSTTISSVEVPERPAWKLSHHRHEENEEPQPIENQDQLLAKPIEMPKKLSSNIAEDDHIDEDDDDAEDDDEAKIDAMKQKLDEKNLAETDE